MPKTEEDARVAVENKLIQPLPWRPEHETGDWWRVRDANGFMVFDGITGDEAAFICRAVNSHEALVTACRIALAWHGPDGDGISDPARAQLLAAVALAEAPK